MTILCYPRCSTCAKACKWLDEMGLAYTYRDIQKENPDAKELALWQKQSGLPLKRFFNTSGLQYRQRQLAQKLPAMSEEEQLAELASDGMLVKRPLLIAGATVLVGFKPQEWQQKLL